MSNCARVRFSVCLGYQHAYQQKNNKEPCKDEDVDYKLHHDQGFEMRNVAIDDIVMEFHA